MQRIVQRGIRQPSRRRSRRPSANVPRAPRLALLVAGLLGVGCGEPERSSPNVSTAGEGAVDGCRVEPATDEPTDFRFCSEDPVLRRSVHLRKQEDVDALSGCERIVGDLTVGLYPGVDSSPLRSLREVTGKLWITSSACGSASPAALAGLESLQAVGALRLYDVPLEDLSILSGLRRVGHPEGGGSVTLSTCPELTSLEGMRGWGRLGDVSLFGLRNLTSLEGLEGLSIERLRMDEVGIGSLSGLSSLQALSELTLSYDDRLTSLSGLGAIAGGLETLELRAHSSLRSLEGLGALPALQRLILVDLPSLEAVAGAQLPASLDVVRLESLRSISSASAIAALESVGDLTLAELPLSLRELVPTQVGALHLEGGRFATLTGLEEVRGLQALSIRENPSLVSLEGLAGASGLVSLELERLPLLGSLGSVSLAASMRTLSLRDVGLSSSTPLAGVQSVTSLLLSETALTELDALSSLEAVGELELFGNARLADAAGLASLRRVERLTFYHNERLAELPTFSALRADPDFPPSVTVLANRALREGPSFPLLTRVDALSIHYNANLQAPGDYPQLSEGRRISIEDNPRLSRVQLPALASAGELVIVSNGPIPEADLGPLRALSGAKIGINGTPWPDQCLWPNDGVCDEVAGRCDTGSDPDCRLPAPVAEFRPPAPSPHPAGLSTQWLPVDSSGASGLVTEEAFRTSVCAEVGQNRFGPTRCPPLEELLETGCFRVSRGCGLTKAESTAGGFAGGYYWYEGWQRPPVGVGSWTDVGSTGPFATRELACAEIETTCDTCGAVGPSCAEVDGSLPPDPPAAPAPPENCACERDERGVAHVSLDCFCSAYECPTLPDATDACVLSAPFAAGAPLEVKRGCDRIEVRSAEARYVFDATSGALLAASAERFGTPTAPCGAARVEAGGALDALCETTRGCGCGDWSEASCVGQPWLARSGRE